MTAGSSASSLSADQAELFGRAKELGLLEQRLDAALSSSGSLVIISGEGGSGKSTLLRALCTRAAARGVESVWGRCWEGGGAPSFWPWTQALRGVLGLRADSDPLAAAGPRSRLIARLIPELADDGAGALEAEGEQAEFALADALAAVLGSVASSAGLIVVIEDLQAADPSSLTMLDFVARQAQGQRLLVVASVRKAEADLDPGLAPLLADLVTRAQTVELSGLAPEAIAEMLGSPGEPAPVALSERLHALTGGNPFYLSELVRLQGDGAQVDASTLPESIRALIKTRIGLLGAPNSDLLGAAAVIGFRFTLDTLAALAALDSSAAAELLSRAIKLDLIVPEKRDAPTFRFAHELLREVILDDMAPADVGRLHETAAELLEVRGAGSAEVAHHHLAALRAGRGSRRVASNWLMRAAADAAELLAHADAIDQLERALELMGSEPDSETERCRALLALGRAQWRAGRSEESKKSFGSAYRLARSIGSSEEMAQSVLGFGGRFGWVEATAEVDREHLAMLEGALEAQPEGDSGLTAEVMARLSMALYFSPEEMPRRLEISAEALAMAERANDPSATAYCLNARRFVLWEPDQLGERRIVGKRLVDVAKAAGEPELELRGHGWVLVDAIETGDAAVVDGAGGGHTGLAEALRQPLFEAEAVKIRAARALLAGRLDEGERLLAEYGRVSDAVTNADVSQVFASHLFMVRGLQGRMDELVAGAEQLAERFPGASTWLAALAFAQVELGRREEAETILASLAASDFTFPRQPGTWVIAVFLCGEVAAQLRDRANAERLYARLEPLSGRMAVSGYAVATLGAVDRVLGSLARVRRDFDAAERHLVAAIELERRLGALPWITWSRIELARLLLERNRGGDREAAITELSRAREAAADLGLVRMLEKLAELSWESELETEVTLMFSDIVDSTATVARLGDKRWMATLRAHNSLVRHQIRRNGGYEVKTQGDGFMVAFSAPDRALRAATAIQRELAENPIEEPIEVRIGLHTGAALTEAGDFFGSAVNLAARVAGQAEAGEILVSGELMDLVGGEFRFGNDRHAELKGFSGTKRMAELLWVNGVSPD